MEFAALAMSDPAAGADAGRIAAPNDCAGGDLPLYLRIRSFRI